MMTTPDSYTLMLQALSQSKRVLITTHVRPDGDALGSTAAMVLAMRSVGIETHTLLLSHLPPKYAFVFNDNNIAFTDVETAWPDPFERERYDCLLVIDTGAWSQLPGLKERIAGWDVPKLVIDHHLTQEDWATQKLVVTEAAAAGEVVAELLKLWKIPITSPIASALFVAIVSDTGWFQFSNTRPFTLRLAAQLMEAGVDTDSLYQHLYQNERAERLALQTRAQESLDLHADGRVAVMCLRRQDFDETRANEPDTENLINIPLMLASVQVSILIVEPRDFGPIRVSLRSKGEVDVARFAEPFGGGGHARAAGLKLDGDVTTVRQRVVEAMERSMGGMPAP